MKKIIILGIVVLMLVVAQLTLACVGRTVHLGISNSANERLMAEMASLLIIERTGTTVQIDVYKSHAELLKAVKQGNVNIIFENTAQAAEVVGKAADVPFAQIKTDYRTKLNLTWLEPFGGAVKYGPVLTSETLATYPALPKLLNKLAGALANDTYPKLQKTADSNDKAKKVAKDFLKSKKLI